MTYLNELLLLLEIDMIIFLHMHHFHFHRLYIHKLENPVFYSPEWFYESGMFFCLIMQDQSEFHESRSVSLMSSTPSRWKIIEIRFLF